MRKLEVLRFQERQGHVKREGKQRNADASTALQVAATMSHVAVSLAALPLVEYCSTFCVMAVSKTKNLMPRLKGARKLWFRCGSAIAKDG